MSNDLPDDVARTIRAKLAASPTQMTLQLARDLGVAEADVIRCMPEGQSVELDPTHWRQLLEAMPPFGRVHVIVSNEAVTMESNGEFGNFSTTGDFFNVQTKTLDMHIRWTSLGTIFAVVKPSHQTGISTLSYQFYDKDGHSAFKVFLTIGNHAAPPSLQKRFEELRAKHRLA